MRQNDVFSALDSHTCVHFWHAASLCSRGTMRVRSTLRDNNLCQRHRLLVLLRAARLEDWIQYAPVWQPCDFSCDFLQLSRLLVPYVPRCARKERLQAHHKRSLRGCDRGGALLQDQRRRAACNENTTNYKMGPLDAA